MAKQKRHYGSAQLCLAALLSVSGAVLADTTPDDAQLNEIVVTATRRQEDLQKVPISVSTLSQSELAAANIKNIAEVAAATPGLLLARRSLRRRLPQSTYAVSTPTQARPRSGSIWMTLP